MFCVDVDYVCASLTAHHLRFARYLGVRRSDLIYFGVPEPGDQKRPTLPSRSSRLPTFCSLYGNVDVVLDHFARVSQINAALRVLFSTV